MEYLDTNINIRFDEKSHIYRVNGEIYPSVTTILNILNKPALVYWAANTTIDYLSAHIDDIKTNKLDLNANKQVFKDAKEYHRKLKERAADTGTKVHYVIEQFLKGREYKHLIDEETELSYAAFLKWRDEQSFGLIDSERIVYSLKYKVAGTADIIAELNGKNFLIDLKTGNAIYDSAIMQISVYRKLFEQNFGLKIQGLAILHLNKNTGKFKFHEYTNQQYRDAYKSFVYLSKFYHSIHKNNKGMTR